MNTTTNGHATKKTRTKGTTVVVKAPKTTTEQPEEIELFQIEKSVVACTIFGTSPLIVNNFNEKSVTEMEDLRRLSDDQKRENKKAPRPPVIPEERFQLARILDEEGRDCVPARWIKAALVTGCKYPDVGIASTQLRGAVYVLGDLIPIKFKGDKSGLPFMRRDVVRVGRFPNKQPDLRYRPEYRDWSLDLRIEFEPKLISLRALYHLVRRAGTSVGLCEWRPEKSPAGIYGRFDIREGT